VAPSPYHDWWLARRNSNRTTLSGYSKEFVMSVRDTLVRSISLIAVILMMAATISAQNRSGGGAPPSANGAPSDIIAALEAASPNRVLQRTYFKTENTGFINLTTTFVNAFTDTVVNCPGAAGTTCTVAVTVSSQFGQISGTDVARARVFVNGTLTPPGDSCCLNLSRNAGVAPQTNTMTFVKTGVPVGNRVVRVQFALRDGPTGYADFRTLEIRVLKP